MGKIKELLAEIQTVQDYIDRLGDNNSMTSSLQAVVDAALSSITSTPVVLSDEKQLLRIINDVDLSPNSFKLIQLKPRAVRLLVPVKKD